MKPTIKPINISFRVFSPQDVDAVLVIEQLAYKTPWRRVQFIQSLSNPNILAYLILKDNRIVGYSIALHTLDFTDLLNICIHPQYQHQGLGAQLFNHLLNVSNIKEVFIEVRVTNYNALLFYKKLGFKVINIRKKYYSDGEDAKMLHFSISS
jgi:ribosomal-protein-alanine N-acetyltransferase